MKNVFIRIATSVITAGLFTGTAHAGFGSWTTDVDADPFSGGNNVTVSYMSSLRSGATLLCDSATKALTVRVIPGFVYDIRMEGFQPEMKFAIDSKKLEIDAVGETGSVGDNLAIAQTVLTGDDAKAFVDAFASAKKQVAVKDGISSKPFIGKATGSTAAGKALLDCLK